MAPDGHDPLNVESENTHVPITDLPYLVMPSNGTVHIMCQMYPLDSVPVSRVLTNCTVFQIRSLEARRDKRPTLALVLQDHIPFFLDTDLSTAKFLSRQNLKIENREQAKRLMLAFCDLRGYQSRDGLPPEMVDKAEMRDPAWRSHWLLQITEREKLWTINCAIETETIGGPWCYAYTLTITPTGVIGVQRGRVLIEGLRTM
jgi:hypothetical protein